MSVESNYGDDNNSGVSIYGGRYVQYNIYGNLFEVSKKYVPPLRPIGRGASGIVCAAWNSETGEEVAIKKIGDSEGDLTRSKVISNFPISAAPTMSSPHTTSPRSAALPVGIGDRSLFSPLSHGKSPKVYSLGNSSQSKLPAIDSNSQSSSGLKTNSARVDLSKISSPINRDHKMRTNFKQSLENRSMISQEQKAKPTYLNMVDNNLEIRFSIDSTHVAGSDILDIPQEVLDDSEPLWKDLIVGRFLETPPHIGITQVITIKDIIRPPQRHNFNDVHIVFELMDTDLNHIIRFNQPLTDDHSRFFLYQLLRGLKYVHSANVLHRDLKPSNLLVNANCDLKIGDFGLARTKSETDSMTEYVVTRWYRAPELLLNCSEYTAAIDIWSVGCIFGETMTREPLFPGGDYVQQLRLITELIGSPDESSLGFLRSDNVKRYVRQLPQYQRQNFAARFPNMSVNAVDLLQKMLVFDPNRRITVDEALCHPYLAPLHDVNEEPVCVRPFSFDFDQPSLTEENIKELIYRESLKFNPLDS